MTYPECISSMTYLPVTRYPVTVEHIRDIDELLKKRNIPNDELTLIGLCVWACGNTGKTFMNMQVIKVI